MDLQTVTDVLGSIASAIAIVSAIIIAVRYLRDRRKRGNRDKDDTPPGSGRIAPVVVVLATSGTVVILTVVAHAAALPSSLLNTLVLAQIALLSGAVSTVAYEGLRIPLYQRDARLEQLQSALAGAIAQLRSLQDNAVSVSRFSADVTNPASSNALAALGAAIANQSNFGEQLGRLLEQQNALTYQLGSVLADLGRILEQLRAQQADIARAYESRERSERGHIEAARDMQRSVEQLAALISEVYGVDRVPPHEPWDLAERGEGLSAPGSRAIRRPRSRWRFWSRR